MRDFVSVHDIVQANLLAMERSSADGLALNVASGEPVNVREVASTLAVELGVEIAPELTEKISGRRHPALFCRYFRRLGSLRN